MIKVHALQYSRAHRILWLLEELSLDYEVVTYTRDPQTLAAEPALRAVHPLGKSPIIVTDGTVLAESGAIIEFLLERHDTGTLRPAPKTDAGTRFLYWLHFAEGSLMPPLLIKLYLGRVGEVPEQVAQRVDGQVFNALEYANDELAKRDFFAGQFSAADIQMSYPVQAAAMQPGFADRFPNLQAWLDRIAERPAYKRAIERGGEPMIPRR
ncbi:glutathione S-transferase [Mesorhizobium sp. RP14(2022)]|uniref:Glutathione S-transferase n=1 Tax=Mesorhizobium liriopis TaxID=2953882 RepID=A0ABT1C4Z8_9HYPH|nr:glutathione S-transferase [Mesorhizobium liriopis]MCO6049901.1 glutathione S-transferase [Mesorhizobium liriopis]